MTTEFNLSTPPLLFSAISLILLAYTNRFLSYASTVRNLKERYEKNPEAEPTSLKQIENLYRRLDLIRWMQVLGASSLLVSLVAMFLYYLEWNVIGGAVFGVGMVLLALSLCICIWEIQISVKALNLSLQSIRREHGSLRQRPDDETLQREKSRSKRKKSREGKEPSSQTATPNQPQAQEKASASNQQGGNRQPRPERGDRNDRSERNDRPERGERREQNRPERNAERGNETAERQAREGRGEGNNGG